MSLILGLGGAVVAEIDIDFGAFGFSIRMRAVSKLSETIEIRVHIDFPGCESKVRSTLQKLKGIDNVEIDMALQKVTVTGWARARGLSF
ncbi:putative heavy metal-associated domain, HMA [Rosa chinensis]|uniref:Putative heavy metal-associated domain, HMA n=1 Tax=Rosa chinensis TaxID=74649 RepID=A0A2P6QGY6_ROSCH|nr:putative heavy metal-associated domain, HMA [Rosa chinensis]